MAPLRPRTGLRLAKEIRVNRDKNGAPRITIDGQQLPYYTQGIVPRAPSLDDMTAVTITIPAEQITLVDDWGAGIPDQADEQPMPLCVSCGREPGVYENYRGQRLCWPCADGTSPEGQAAVAESIRALDERQQTVSDTPLPPVDSPEARDVLLAVLVDRLGGTVTVTNAELHAMRDSPRCFTALRDPDSFAWTMALIP